MMGVAVASAEPYANHLHLTPDRTTPAPHHSIFFTGRMPFLPPNQQRQITEGQIYTLYQAAVYVFLCVLFKVTQTQLIGFQNLG